MEKTLQQIREHLAETRNGLKNNTINKANAQFRIEQALIWLGKLEEKKE